MAGWLILAAAAAGVLAVKLVVARVKPLKNHRFCGGRGLDPRCGYSGKVLRFGARWMRPELRGRYR